MRTIFTPSPPNKAKPAPPATKRTMGSHFLMSGAAMACALSATTAMMPGVCSGQIAADYATDPTYSGGWAAGQNGGVGFRGGGLYGGEPTPGGGDAGRRSSLPLPTT